MRRHQISIHALREEGDLYPSRSRHIRLISIHALREEGDGSGSDTYMTSLDISIHALREEGDVVSVGGFQHPFLFLSTPSARRATGTITYLGSTMMISIHALREEGDNSTFMAFSTSAMISIHALREEGDPTVAAALQAKTEFLSTPSARRATQCRPAYP